MGRRQRLDEIVAYSKWMRDVMRVKLDLIMLTKCEMRSLAKKVGQGMPINAAFLAS